MRPVAHILDQVDCNESDCQGQCRKVKFLHREDNLDVDAFVKTQVKNYEPSGSAQGKRCKGLSPRRWLFADFSVGNFGAVSRQGFTWKSCCSPWTSGFEWWTLQFFVRLWLVRIYSVLAHLILQRVITASPQGASQDSTWVSSHFMLTRLTSMFRFWCSLQCSSSRCETANNEITSYLLQAFWERLLHPAWEHERFAAHHEEQCFSRNHSGGN